MNFVYEARQEVQLITRRVLFAAREYWSKIVDHKFSSLNLTQLSEYHQLPFNTVNTASNSSVNQQQAERKTISFAFVLLSALLTQTCQLLKGNPLSQNEQ